MIKKIFSLTMFMLVVLAPDAHSQEIKKLSPEEKVALEQVVHKTMQQFCKKEKIHFIQAQGVFNIITNFTTEVIEKAIPEAIEIDLIHLLLCAPLLTKMFFGGLTIITVGTGYYLYKQCLKNNVVLR